MKAMIVYGRGLDENNKQLYMACKKFIGKPVLARIMDMSAYIGQTEADSGTEIKNSGTLTYVSSAHWGQARASR